MILPDTAQAHGCGNLEPSNPIPLPLRCHNVNIDGLYIHVPFCFHKCHYCDFYSVVDPQGSLTGKGETEENRQTRFTTRLIQEIQQRSGQIKLRPRTIFIGGGTPTLLAPRLWQRLFVALHAFVDMAGVQEFTVEANPETITPRIATVLAAGGVNRVSIGAQSFHTPLLKTLERWHDPANVTKAVQTVRAEGIQNINVDLIFAIPGQSLPVLEADLDAALALAPDHISCYGLTYEPQTALAVRRQMGQIHPVDQEVERQMYERVMARLDTAGFEHYEISSWSTPSRHCEHNLIYWHNGDWLGMGPSAASHINGYRWKNRPHLGHYLSQSPEPPTTEHEHLSDSRSTGEQLMLRLRLREGVPRYWLDQRLLRHDPRHATIRDFIERGLLEWTGQHLRLTQRGIFVADMVIEKLL